MITWYLFYFHLSHPNKKWSADPHSWSKKKNGITSFRNRQAKRRRPAQVNEPHEQRHPSSFECSESKFEHSSHLKMCIGALILIEDISVDKALTGGQGYPRHFLKVKTF